MIVPTYTEEQVTHEVETEMRDFLVPLSDKKFLSCHCWLIAVSFKFSTYSLTVNPNDDNLSHASLCDFILNPATLLWLSQIIFKTSSNLVQGNPEVFSFWEELNYYSFFC